MFLLVVTWVMSLLKYANRITPYACRLLSGKEVKDIANGSGMSVSTVIRLSKLHSWESVDVGTASRFMEGCGIDIADLSAIKDYARKCVRNPDRAFEHIKSKRVRAYLGSLA